MLGEFRELSEYKLSLRLPRHAGRIGLESAERDSRLVLHFLPLLPTSSSPYFPGMPPLPRLALSTKGKEE